MAKSFQKCGEVSSGAFIASFVSASAEVNSGATGTIATITPPAGERVKLTGLVASASQSNLTTVTVGGVDVIIDATLNKHDAAVLAAGFLSIGYSEATQDSFFGGTDEVFEIKTNVATSSDTHYTYQFGV